MGRLLIAGCAATALLLAQRAGASAGEFDLSVDLRAVASDATQSRLTGGLGKLRFDSVLVPTSRQPRSHWLMLVAQARGRLCLPCRRQRSSTSPFGV